LISPLIELFLYPEDEKGAQMSENMIWIGVSFLLGGGVGFLLMRLKYLPQLIQSKQQLEEVKKELFSLSEKSNQLIKDLHRAEQELAISEVEIKKEKELFEEKLRTLSEAEKRMGEHFQSLSSQVMNQNNESFLRLAQTTFEKMNERSQAELEKKHTAFEEVVKPVKESLEKVDLKIQELEKVRVGAYQGLREQVAHLAETQNHLRSETANLVKALRSPGVRGRWGEIQLKRVVEMAGMLDHCDFYEQETVSNSEGRFRPDLVVRLPGGKQIVVDSKVALSSYLESIEEKDEEIRLQHLKAHARQVRTHMAQLSKKSYWDQFSQAPEFVVLFLPGEIFFSAALEQDPGLIEAGVEQRVILATPTTLIALLRAVAYGWRQEALTKNAQQIGQIGKEIYKRMSDLSGHLGKMGKHLNLAVDSFNRTVGTYESRVLVSARKFNELDLTASDSVLEEIPTIDATTRRVHKPDSDDSSQKEIESL
tara:strand:+ start:5303 stop:6742 length:1440 start_codon:yes stop_codon:yes gene_type:complete